MSTRMYDSYLKKVRWYRDQGLTTTLFFVVVPGFIKATNVIIADVVIVLYSVNSYTGISFVVVSLVFDTRYLLYRYAHIQRAVTRVIYLNYWKYIFDPRKVVLPLSTYGTGKFLKFCRSLILYNNQLYSVVCNRVTLQLTKEKGTQHKTPISFHE